MNHSIRFTTLLILAALCGSIYLLTFGFYKSEQPLYFGVAFDDIPSSDNLLQMHEQLKLKPQIMGFNLLWPSQDVSALTDFPMDAVKNIYQAGMTPSIAWSPLYGDKKNQQMISFNEITNGSYDPYLKKFSEGVKQLDFPLIIRFAPNINDEKTYAHADTYSVNLSLYKETYQYLIDFFRKQNIKNIYWVFSVSTNDSEKIDRSRLAKFYPGDHLIDIIEMDGFNHGIEVRANQWDSRWQGFDTIFGTLYHELKALAPYKPIIISETIFVQNEKDKDARNEWIIQALDTCKAWEIVAFVWFNENAEHDWKIPALDEHIREFFTEKPLFHEWLNKLRK